MHTSFMSKFSSPFHKIVKLFDVSKNAPEEFNQILTNCWLQKIQLFCLMYVMVVKRFVSICFSSIQLLILENIFEIFATFYFKRQSARTTDTQWRHMLRPYLKFGIGSWFSAVQWRQFPHRASVVRDMKVWYNFCLSNFVKLSCHGKYWYIVLIVRLHKTSCR